MMNSRLRGVNLKLLGLLTPLVVTLLVVLFLLRSQISYALHSTAFSIGRLIWPVTDQAKESSNVEQARNESVTRENEELKRALGYVDTESAHLSYVLSSLRSSPYETIIIDQGGAAGVEYGQKVVSEGGVALGEVVEVYDKVSKVQLYSAYGKELEVVLPDGTHVVAAGAGSQNFVLNLPSGLEIGQGAMLALPSSRNLIVAQVKEVRESPGDAFQIVYARSPINIHSLSRVYVEN